MFCFEAERCPRIGLCLFIKVVKLLFIMIMDALTKDVRDGSLMELLCGQPSFAWEVVWGGALYDQDGVWGETGLLGVNLYYLE